MARLAAAFASSHSVMLTCSLNDWQRGFRTFDLDGTFHDNAGHPRAYAEILAMAPPNARELVTDGAIASRYAAVHEAMGTLRDKIARARLDALVIVGDDQRELFRDTLMPSIGVYYGATIRNAASKDLPASEWYRRAQMRRLEDHTERDYPVHAGIALHFIEGLIESGFDVAALKGLSEGQYEGHAFSFVHRTYLQGSDTPVVPVFLNTFFPPNQPTPARCLALGAALRGLIESFPGHLNVGVHTVVVCRDSMSVSFGST